MPFFIQWQIPPGEHPGLTPIQHRVAGVEGISRIEVAGDASHLTDWLGTERLPIEVVADDPPGVLTILVATANGPEGLP